MPSFVEVRQDGGAAFDGLSFDGVPFALSADDPILSSVCILVLCVVGRRRCRRSEPSVASPSSCVSCAIGRVRKTCRMRNGCVRAAPRRAVRGAGCPQVGGASLKAKDFIQIGTTCWKEKTGMAASRRSKL